MVKVPRAPALRALAVMLLAAGAALVWAHVTLFPPVLGGMHALHADMPESHDEVRVVTDEAVRVGSTGENSLALVCADVGCPYVIRAEPEFNATNWGEGERWLFDAVVTADAEWVRVTESAVADDVEAPYAENALLLEGVVWNARPAPMPTPWFAAAGFLALGSALLVLGVEYAPAGVAIALGFLVQHAVGLTGRLMPAIGLYLGGWLIVVAGVVCLVGGVAVARWRGYVPVGVLFLALAAGIFLERALVAGYRPFTGIY